MDEKLRDGILFRLLAVGAGLALSGLLLVFIDRNPIEVYRILFASLFRDKYTFFDIFVKATPLIFTGLAFTFTYKASLFNIGAQGQFYIGAIYLHQNGEDATKYHCPPGIAKSPNPFA